MNAEQVWSKVLEFVKGQISSANYKGWFKKAIATSMDDQKITLTVPSAFVKSQLISRYDRLIKEALEKVLEKGMNVDYLIDSTKFSKKNPDETETGGGEESTFEFESPVIPAPTYGLNPKYTIENFVVGLTNNLAFAAAQATIQNPGISYNPLFIYGPSGVGKTHLMQAIGNALLRKNLYTRLLFAPSEKFMNDLVYSIQNKRTGEFKQKYRSCDALLIDDIQFISGKDSTQEEFFHTFNELQTRNAQIVLTSDRPPHEMEKLESRLLSRFQGGLMVDIQLPDYDTRMAILKSKLVERGETLPEEYIKIIAETIPSSTRELEGKLIQLLQMAKMNQLYDEDAVRRVVGTSQSSNQNPLDQKKVLGGINQYFNLKMSDLIGPRRQKELVLPRQIAMFILYEDCKIPLEKIGQILGGRDHTTILHGVEKIRGAITRDREIQKLLIEVKQSLFS